MSKNVKRSIISCEYLTNFTFFDMQEQQQPLSYYFGGEYKELHLVIPSSSTITDLIQGLEGSELHLGESQGLYLVVNQELLDLFLKDELMPELGELRSVVQIEP